MMSYSAQMGKPKDCFSVTLKQGKSALRVASDDNVVQPNYLALPSEESMHRFSSRSGNSGCNDDVSGSKLSDWS